jgi:hypothetical protein
MQMEPYVGTLTAAAFLLHNNHVTYLTWHLQNLMVYILNSTTVVKPFLLVALPIYIVGTLPFQLFTYENPADG